VVAEQLREIGMEADIVLEPMRRDSGPAVVVAAALAARRDPQAAVLVLAADHVVREPREFIAGCRNAAVAVAHGQIVNFGIRPTAPATSYGYIRPGAQWRRRARHRSLRREAGYRDRGALPCGGLFLEQRQLHVGLLGAAKRTASADVRTYVVLLDAFLGDSVTSG
jgi:hypothetical protein